MFELYYPLSAGVNFLLGALMGVLVLLRDPKKLVNVTFSLFAFAFSVWSFGYVMWQISTEYSTALFWSRLLMAGAIFIPLFYFHFVMAFLKKCDRWRWLIRAAYGIFITFFLLNFTPLFVSHMEALMDFKLWPIAGPTFGVFLAFWFGTVIFFCVLLFQKYQNKKTRSFDKKQIKLLLVGIALSFIGGGTNFFLWYRIPIPPYGNIFASLYVVLTGYAILKYKFFDIRLIIARTMSFMMLVVLFGATYASGVLSIGYFVSQRVESIYINVIVQTLLALFIGFTFYPLRKKFEKITDKIFFQSLPVKDVFLKEIGVIVSQTLDLEFLAKNLLKKIIKDFKLEKGILFTVDSKRHLHSAIEKDTNLSLDLDRVEKYLLKLRKPLKKVEDLKNSNMRQYLRDHNYSLILKFETKNVLLGYLLLGDKKSGTQFLDLEIQLLELIIPSVSVGLNNALQYAEIQAFSETLRGKVREATGKLRNANDKLKELDKRKDEFLNVAAHELRAPLTAVKGYLAMISDGDAGDVNDTVKEFLKGAITGAEREVRLVNNMLNMSRIEENRLVYRMGVVDLSEVVNEVYMEFKIQAEEKGLKLNLEMDKDVKDLVYVDEDRIHEVVANFVSNAVKYTDSGMVNVRVKESELSGFVRVEVEDSGYGMTDEEQKKLFTKFYRAESSAGKVLGTGLGLYVTKLLIDKFEGRLGLESERGKGSMFWFELPVTRRKMKK